MKWKVFIPIFLVVLILLMLFIFPDKKDKVLPSPKEVKKDVKKIIDVSLEPSVTASQIKDVTGYEVSKFAIMVGKDSFLREEPTEDLIKKYKLERYYEQRVKFENVVEEKFLKNLNYTLLENVTLPNGNVEQKMEVIGFYYELYLTDLSELTNKLYVNSGYSLDNAEEKSEYEIAYYKAKAKAMQLIDPFLSSYDNYGEKAEFSITYINGKPKDSNEIVTLYLNLKGATYPNMDFSKQENIDTQKARIEKYISNGYKTGIIKKDNLLD